MSVKKVVLKVIGEQTIHCTGCESTIHRALSQIPGIRLVSPSHETQLIELTLDTDKTAIETVREKLAWMGWQTNEPEVA